MEQTKTKPQEILEFQMNNQIQTFSSSPPINLVEEGTWLLAVNSFETTNSVFNITDKNISFSFTIPAYWTSREVSETIIKLGEILELREQIDAELHVKEIR